MDQPIKPLGKTCSATGRPLQPGERCRSALVERGTDLVRLDFAPEAWTGPPTGTVATWEVVVPVPLEAATKRHDADEILRYFEELCEASNPLQDKLRYVLALWLLQKRRLRQDGTRSEGDVQFLQLSAAAGEFSCEVPELRLSPDEVQTLQRELDVRLGRQAA
jgi:hypothetical protein